MTPLRIPVLVLVFVILSKIDIIIAQLDPYDNSNAATNFKFEFKNGQKIYFASGVHLEHFSADPSSAFDKVVGSKSSIDMMGEMEMMNMSHHDSGDHIEGGCPVCGMSVSKTSAHVKMIHGDQAIYTCSQNHAKQVFENPLAYAENPPKPSAGKICRGVGTVMFNGFQTINEHGDCVLLWFRGWTLDTEVKLVFGWLAVFVAAMTTELLQAIRRKLRNSTRPVVRLNDHSETATLLYTERSKNIPKHKLLRLYLRLPGSIQHGIQSIVHGVCISVAYLLMLAAMTYSVSLFAFIVLGFIVGHYIFADRNGDISDYVDPCCTS